MNVEAMIYGWLAGILLALMGMVLGSKLRPLVGKTDKSVAWSDAAWCLVYALPTALWWGLR